MRKLTKIIAATLVAATALGGAGVASAQDFGHGRPGHATPVRADAIRDQLQDLQTRIDRNDFRDRISPREAAGLRREIRDARQQFRWFNRDGLDQREMRTLQNRIDHIRGQLRMERNDNNGHRW